MCRLRQKSTRSYSCQAMLSGYDVFLLLAAKNNTTVSHTFSWYGLVEEEQGSLQSTTRHQPRYREFQLHFSHEPKRNKAKFQALLDASQTQIHKLKPISQRYRFPSVSILQQTKLWPQANTSHKQLTTQLDKSTL